jgi:hypothetical protein
MFLAETYNASNGIEILGENGINGFYNLKTFDGMRRKIIKAAQVQNFRHKVIIYKLDDLCRYTYLPDAQKQQLDFS